MMALAWRVEPPRVVSQNPFSTVWIPGIFGKCPGIAARIGQTLPRYGAYE